MMITNIFLVCNLCLTLNNLNILSSILEQHATLCIPLHHLVDCQLNMKINKTATDTMM